MDKLIYVSPSTVGTCDDEGYTADGSLPYYTGRTKMPAGSWLPEPCTACSVPFTCMKVWDMASVRWCGRPSKIPICAMHPLLVEGLSAELGAMYRWRMLMLSAGVTTIAADWWEMNVGIGISFEPWNSNTS